MVDQYRNRVLFVATATDSVIGEGEAGVAGAELVRVGAACGGWAVHVPSADFYGEPAEDGDRVYVERERVHGAVRSVELLDAAAGVFGGCGGVSGLQRDSDWVATNVTGAWGDWRAAVGAIRFVAVYGAEVEYGVHDFVHRAGDWDPVLPDRYLGIGDSGIAFLGLVEEAVLGAVGRGELCAVPIPYSD